MNLLKRIFWKTKFKAGDAVQIISSTDKDQIGKIFWLEENDKYLKHEYPLRWKRYEDSGKIVFNIGGISPDGVRIKLWKNKKKDIIDRHGDGKFNMARKLDFYLGYLIKKQEMDDLSEDVCFIYHDQMEGILADKLVKDGYIIECSSRNHIVTSDGILFYFRGGYWSQESFINKVKFWLK